MAKSHHRDAGGPIIDASHQRRLFFAFFIVSGFCGLLYQVVWLRLAFASFGIITPIISVVISVFMLGLALGSWAGGRWMGARASSGLLFYAGAEVVIGLGALAVPALFSAGAALLTGAGETNTGSYLAASGIVIALSILPFAFAMGTTYPFVMGHIESRGGDSKSFSHLYLANVIGASLGALLAAGAFVELFGFRRTLWIAGAANVLIATLAITVMRRGARLPGPTAGYAASRVEAEAAPAPRRASAILFLTGFVSLAMEVVWARTFTPVLGTQVYAFASLLVTYLVATWVGSFVYRRHLARGRVPPEIGTLLAATAACAFLPILVNDPRIADGPGAGPAALASIVPLCALLGYLTPRVMDLTAAGRPAAAGRAYAINALGCILGPLLASYLLLPLVGARIALVILAAPLLALAWLHRADFAPAIRRAGYAVASALVAIGAFVSVSFEDPCAQGRGPCELRRDYTATVASYGEGRDRQLLVNGMGITGMTPITKYMAHLPVLFHAGEPRTGLVICFGMGTTFRSLLSWDIETTAVELVPSVRDAFAYYHADAEAMLRDPRGRIVIDDGRRFLERTDERYDVIIIDPPPPVETAGSSLLYSREFHEAVRRRLAPGGVLQTWVPPGERAIDQAVVRSVQDTFRYVRVFRSLEGWGYHLIASDAPLRDVTVASAVARMPAKVRADLAEWTTGSTEREMIAILSREARVADLLPRDPRITITDDRPFNEYYLLRRWMGAY